MTATVRATEHCSSSNAFHFMPISTFSADLHILSATAVRAKRTQRLQRTHRDVFEALILPPRTPNPVHAQRRV
jgi:hypothetical protein